MMGVRTTQYTVRARPLNSEQNITAVTAEPSGTTRASEANRGVDIEPVSVHEDSMITVKGMGARKTKGKGKGKKKKEEKVAEVVKVEAQKAEVGKKKKGGKQKGGEKVEIRKNEGKLVGVGDRSGVANKKGGETGVNEEITKMENGTLNAVENIENVNGNALKNVVVKAGNNKIKKKVRMIMERRSNKILGRSRKKSPVKPARVLPARASARLCIRKNSGELENRFATDKPLRTVELIKRPLELREPATKLLYLASLALYPKADPESDTTPIVIISEEIPNPGGKKPKYRNLELPLFPSRMDLNQLKSYDLARKSETITKSEEIDATDAFASDSGYSDIDKQKLLEDPTKPSTAVSRKNEVKIEPVKIESSGVKLASPNLDNELPILKTDKAAAAPVKRKRKSLESIIKEIPKTKQQRVEESTFPCLPNCEPQEVICNKILEELIKNPMKNRPKSDVTIEASLMSVLALQNNPISMTVPLQPAPGIPNTPAELFSKAHSKKAKMPFQLPMPLPIPIPPGLLNYTSLSALPKLKKQRKPKFAKASTILDVPSLPQVQQPRIQTIGKPKQIAQIPYLPSHLQAFYHDEGSTPTVNQQNPLSLKRPQMDEALDLCVKALPTISSTKKTRKPKQPKQSLLKPLNVEEDGPLNLVVNRVIVPKIVKKPDADARSVVTESMKTQGNLENVKQMLARLHTKIAPAVNGVQLITIE